MGGRGSRSAGGGGGGNINAMWRQVFQPIGGAVPPTVTPGQPVPAVTQQQLQAMTDTEFTAYLNGLKSTPIDPLTYYNDSWDTQRLVANMPELNRAPQIVDASTFNSLPGDAIYRTVNAGGGQTAMDIVNRTMVSDVTTIGEGVNGDGFYFHFSKSGSQNYGSTRGDVMRTATMSAKLNSNAKIVLSSDLTNMLNGESREVQNAVRGMRSGGTWVGDSGLMAYALKKGYNVINRDGRIYNVIDRTAVTWSAEVVPM